MRRARLCQQSLSDRHSKARASRRTNARLFSESSEDLLAEIQAMALVPWAWALARAVPCYAQLAVPVREIARRYGQTYNSGSFAAQFGSVLKRIWV
jgi:hypothetical protein